MRILVIEDEPNNMMLMTIVLKRYGHEPIEAFTGEEGIEKAVVLHPELILMDIRLPGIDGIEATSRIRKMENIKDVPIIAVTSYSMDWDKETLMKTGFDGLIGKPIDPFTIMDEINGMIREGK